ncbi:unnamed protein product, partial [Symbiodinium sp. KB8]
MQEAEWGFIGDAVEAVGGVVTDGAGLVGDALGDAYEGATDQIAFVANTAIDTVGKAIDILKRGFTDWRAWCSLNLPTAQFSTHGIHIFFGAT